MELFINDLMVKQKILIHNSKIVLPNEGVVLFKGKNGTGKTLLLKSIYSDMREMYNCVFLDQNNDAILTNLTILENITMSVDIDRLEKARHKICSLGFEYLLELSPISLSGGEKRLISILRGLLADSEIIFIDEPTNDLDYKIINEIVYLIKSSVEDSHTLFILATHDDRIIQISDAIFEISNKRLNTVKESISHRNKTYGGFKIKNTKSNFLKQSFGFNYITHILFLIILVIIINESVIYKSQKFERIPVADNQIDIYVPISSLGSRILLDYTIPSKYLMVLEEKDLFKRYQKYMEILKKSDNSIYTFNLDSITSNPQYQVYKLEFYDLAKKQSYFTMDAYLNNYGINSADANVISNNYFYQTYNLKSLALPNHILEIDEFIHTMEELENTKSINGNNLFVLCISIVYNKESYSFDDFIKSEQFVNISSDNYLITSKEIIDYLDESSELKRVKESLSIILVCLLIGLSLEAVYINILMFSSRRSINLIKNYSFLKNDLKRAVNNQYNNRFFKFLFIGLVLLINCIHNVYQSEALLENYVVIILIIFMSISYSLSMKIVNYWIDRIDRWDYRC